MKKKPTSEMKTVLMITFVSWICNWITLTAVHAKDNILAPPAIDPKPQQGFFLHWNTPNQASATTPVNSNNNPLGLSFFLKAPPDNSNTFTSNWLQNMNSNNNQGAFNLFKNNKTNFFSIPGMKEQQPVEPSSAENTEKELAEAYRQDCELSLTSVNGQRVCRKNLIFSEDFKNEEDSMKRWNYEVFIPSYLSTTGESVFNYFDKNNSIIGNGKAVFTPVVMSDDFVRRGALKLNDCTGTTDEECERSAQFQWILPPVASARITTKNTFSFKYGKVEIKAKFPKGDWLVPELWLIPKNSKYGEGLQSGRIVMAMARGNRELKLNNADLDYRVLESSLVMSSGQKIRSRTLRVKSEEPWQAHLNTYQFTWRPDGCSLSVNGVMVGEVVDQNFSGSLASLVGFSHDEQKHWYKGSAFAPFDQEFYISIGLSVGGRDFPDDSMSGDYKKPWKSRTVKEMLSFYRAKEKWEKSWTDEVRKTLTVTRIKVSSL